MILRHDVPAGMTVDSVGDAVHVSDLPDQRATDQRATNQRATDQRATDQRATNQRATDQHDTDRQVTLQSSPGPVLGRQRDVDSALAAARAVPDATVARLAVYLRVLSELRSESVETVSSERLAVVAGVNSAKLRKDLSHLGSYGVRGVGYSVQTLIGQLADTLGLREDRGVVLIGIGNLGQALAGYTGFASRGFRIAALIDADAARVGTVIGGVAVRPIDELAEAVRVEKISIAVIATPGEVAQQVADLLAAAGVTAILNFAPTVLSVPESVNVRRVDLAAELQILSFHEQRKARELALDDARVSS